VWYVHCLVLILSFPAVRGKRGVGETRNHFTPRLWNIPAGLPPWSEAALHHAIFLGGNRRFQNGMSPRAYFSANVPDDLSLLASGVAPAREAEAGGMTEVPKA